MCDGRYVLESDNYAVFDPLGGAAGHHAVLLAREAFRRAVNERRADPRGALMAANAAVHDAVQADPTLKGGGCTAAALAMALGRVTVAWAGDVNVLCLRGERLVKLTRGHSLLNDYLDRDSVRPDDARSRGALPSNIIVRALGMRSALEADVVTEPVEVGDVLVLASSGIYDALGETLLASIAIAHRGDARAAVRALLDNATANAAKDALTAVIVVVGKPGIVAAASSPNT